jgi:hypothetical protein
VKTKTDLKAGGGSCNTCGGGIQLNIDIDVDISLSLFGGGCGSRRCG